MAGEPSPALLFRTRRSTTQPALPRLPSVPPLTGRSPSRERWSSSDFRFLPSAQVSPQPTSFPRQDQTRQDPEGPCCPPFVARGSTLRSAPFSAPPPFELLLEASRRGARALSLSLHPAPCGGRGSQFWLRARELFPQNETLPYMTSDL